MDIERPICSNPECPGKNPVRRKGWRVDKSPIWGSLCGNCHRKSVGRKVKRNRRPSNRGSRGSKEAKIRRAKNDALRWAADFIKFKEFDIVFRGGCQNNSCGLGGLLLPHKCYDYHHIDPDVKIRDVSSVKRLNELAKLEILKCVILCACCHRLIHHNPDLVDLCVMPLDKLLSSWDIECGIIE